MNDKPVQRKPRLYFDTVAGPDRVTFDDGKEEWRNFPWSLYVVARWEYAEPDFLRIEIGDSIVVLRGHNLGPLKQAIEEHTLLRVRCRPELEEDRNNEPDSFVTGMVSFQGGPERSLSAQRRPRWRDRQRKQERSGKKERSAQAELAGRTRSARKEGTPDRQTEKTD